ncbi:MAG: ribonuclease III [Thermoanaerobaculia bacterium]|nr:ribonuclease III [Thermoanaerobaculia bacterium]
MTIDRDLAELERRLGYEFRDRSRLVAALTHRSAAHETDLDTDYERLEFLGDAVLDLAVAEHVYRQRPDAGEGELTRVKSRLVSAEALYAFACELELGEFLLLGLGEERSGGRRKRSLLADSTEALFGAVYLDGGLQAAATVLAAYLAFHQRGAGEAEHDPKSELQQRLQARGLDLPVYEVVAEQGPDHDKTFTVEAVVAGRVAGRGTARTKKGAEQRAAQEALSDGAGEEDYNPRP